MKKIVFTFGRYNPPTTGHAELINYAVRLAHRTGADHRIYTSQSHDSSKNPLAPRQKMMFLRQIFSGVNFIDDPAMKTAFHICKKLAEEGYEDVVFVVGDDRVAEFSNSLGKYVKPRTAKGFNPKIHYPFKKFKVESSGARKQGISGTDLRAAVRKGDFATFAKASAARDKTLARKIFAATKKQLSEDVEILEVTTRDMHKHLTSKGWTLERKGKSHDLYSHPQSKGRRITLPRHPGELDRRLQKEIDKQTDRYIREENNGISRKEFHDKLKSFVDFTCEKLGIDEKPSIRYKEDSKDGQQPSFGGYAPHTKELVVVSKNRHPMDIFRTVAHELVHHKQNVDGRLGKNIEQEGATGSDIENEANAEAGKIMRYFGKENPFYFDMQYVTENRAILLGGVPGSGKDKILKEAILPLGYKEYSQENFWAHHATGENLVINGTMSGYEQTKQIKDILESAGYETIMVFVNTSNEVSKQRNEARSGTGGRVITETTRFAKWKAAQDNLDRYDSLFEKVIEVKNDFNADDLGETWFKLIESISKELHDFTLTESDRRFETMLNEVGGAGNWGTTKLTRRYQKDTPGQLFSKPQPMKVLRLKAKMKEDNNTSLKTPRISPGSMPIGGDRIGDEIGLPKSPTFGDNQTIPTIGNSDPIARWMMKEETKKKFRERYGSLAEQKIKETASRLAKCESLDDPYTGGMSDVSVTGGPPEDVMYGGKRMVGADQEKTSLFGKRKRLNTKKK